MIDYPGRIKLLRGRAAQKLGNIDGLKIFVCYKVSKNPDLVACFKGNTYRVPFSQNEMIDPAKIEIITDRLHEAFKGWPEYTVKK